MGNTCMRADNNDFGDMDKHKQPRVIEDHPTQIIVAR